MLKRILLHLHSTFFRWNLLIIFFVSSIAGFAIVTHGRPEKFPALLRIPGLWSSAMYSSIIAFVLILVIYIVSFIGNAKFAGQEINGRWIRFQFYYGVLLTMVVEIVSATLLFGLHGFWILDTTFFDTIFLPVLLFVTLVNLCYLLFFMQQVRIEVEVPVEIPVEVPVFVPVEVETIRYQAVPLVIAPANLDVETELAVDDPALFYSHNGEVWKKDFAGKKSIWLKSLDVTIKELDSKLYFKGYRNWIAHRKAVAEIQPYSGRRVRIKCIFKVRIKLLVARRNVHQFKEWLYGKKVSDTNADEAVHS